MTAPQVNFQEIEQPAGPPLVEPVDEAIVLERTAAVYRSYEAFLRNRLIQLRNDRPKRWQRDYASVDAYERSIAPMRRRLQAMLGFWIEPCDRAPVNTNHRRLLLDHEQFVAHLFELEVILGLTTYGIELTPRTPAPRPGLLIQHGYSGTPESACGFILDANGEDYSYRSFGIRAALHGFHVIAINHPTKTGLPVDELPPAAGDPPSDTQFGKNRLHRMAVMAGGTLFGLDMLASSRAVDLLAQQDEVDAGRIGMYGLSQGGQSALFLPALDPRIRASVSSAYFNTRLDKLIGPNCALTYLDSGEEDKFFTEVISHFADADIVSLIAPRAFAVEAGLHDSSVDFERSQTEFEQAKVHHEELGLAARIEFIPHEQGHVSATRRAFEFLKEQL